MSLRPQPGSVCSICVPVPAGSGSGCAGRGGGSAPRGSRDTRQHTLRGAGCRRHRNPRVTGPAVALGVWRLSGGVHPSPPHSALHAALPCHSPLPSIFQERQAVTWNGSGPPTAARPRSPKIRPFLINNFPPFGSCWGFFPLRMGGDPLLHPPAPTRRLFPTVLEASPGEKGCTGTPRSRDPPGAPRGTQSRGRIRARRGRRTGGRWGAAAAMGAQGSWGQLASSGGPRESRDGGGGRGWGPRRSWGGSPSR